MATSKRSCSFNKLKYALTALSKTWFSIMASFEIFAFNFVSAIFIF